MRKELTARPKFAVATVQTVELFGAKFVRKLENLENYGKLRIAAVHGLQKMKSVTSHHGAGGLPRSVGACSAARRQEASDPSGSPSQRKRLCRTIVCLRNVFERQMSKHETIHSGKHVTEHMCVP